MSTLACIVYLVINRDGLSLNYIVKLAILFSVIGAYVEFRTRKSIDNLTVPLIVGLIGFFMEQAL